jgi:hypothetical protein
MIFFSPPLLVLLLDPGWIKIRIRDTYRIRNTDCYKNDKEARVGSIAAISNIK